MEGKKKGSKDRALKNTPLLDSGVRYKSVMNSVCLFLAVFALTFGSPVSGLTYIFYCVCKVI